MADPKLITGKQAIPQIGSDDDGAMHAGIFGYGIYLLQNKSGNFPVVTMQNANTASIPDMCLIVEGRFVRQVAATTVTIQSGSSGMKRNDLICLKYVKDSDGNETTTWQVFRGSATSGTPADPTIPSGRIIDGVSTSYTAVARVSLNGITPGTPVMLVTNLPPVGDSVPRMPLIAGGQVGGATNRDGVIPIRYSCPDGSKRKPDSVIVTYGPQSSDITALLFHPVLWSKDPTMAQIRFRRSDSNTWVGSGQGLYLQWIAIWNPV